jgi:hypothetical protein
MDNDEIITTVHASIARRFIGVGTMGGLGALVLYLAFSAPMALHWVVFLIVLGIGALYVAQLMWRVTAVPLELTAEGIRDAEGTVLVRVEDIVSVERSALSIKPSNGFMIRTKDRQARAWRPGMWWRMGRMVAVGGVTPGSQTKPMADMLAALMQERAGE